MEETDECLYVWKEIITRNRKSGVLCGVHYKNFADFCDDYEKSDSAFCVKRVNYA